MTEDEDKSLINAEAGEAEKCPLMQAKHTRQKRDRDDVRSGRRTQASMTFDPEEVCRTFVIKRRSWDY
jgi:hypothetical protein